MVAYQSNLHSMDPTTLAIIAAAVFAAPAVIEMLGPTQGDPDNIARAKRQISGIIATFLGAAGTILQNNGLEINNDSLSLFILTAVLSKAGIQSTHDGYWTDKNVPQLRQTKPL